MRAPRALNGFTRRAGRDPCPANRLSIQIRRGRSRVEEDFFPAHPSMCLFVRVRRYRGSVQGVLMKYLRPSNSASERERRTGRCCPRRHGPLARRHLGRLGRVRFSSHADLIYFIHTPWYPVTCNYSDRCRDLALREAERSLSYLIVSRGGSTRGRSLRCEDQCVTAY